MNRFFTVASGALLGATVAATVVVLFAPQSGEELRQAIRDRIDAIRSAGQQAAEARRLELTKQFQELKQPSEQL